MRFDSRLCAFYNMKFWWLCVALNLLLSDKQQQKDFAKRERIGFKKDKATAKSEQKFNIANGDFRKIINTK